MAIDPLSPDMKLDKIATGNFLMDTHDNLSLSDVQHECIQQLKIQVSDKISLNLSLEDFKSFFRSKQECMSSSPSGHHIGYYKAMLECIRQYNPVIPEIVITIAQISLLTATPLERWSSASQLMLEKEKGSFIEHLRIIQLCEADLNFVLHIIWGHRLTRHALKHSALSTSQYALPGQTCHNAVLNKILYLDLSRQTLSPGIMTDYDASLAFDRVIASLSIIMCQRVGLPRIAGTFMFHLLRNMSFHLVAGFGKSPTSFFNKEDKNFIGQGVLQGSSSVALIYILNSDVSLATYNKLAHGAAFTHPITGETIHDEATQYVDDTSQVLNPKGINSDNNISHEMCSFFFNIPNKIPTCGMILCGSLEGA
jgi:hypothetical protein